MRENNKFRYLISFSSSPSSSLLYPFMSLPSSVSTVISSPSFPLQISIFHNGLNMSFSVTQVCSFLLFFRLEISETRFQLSFLLLSFNITMLY